MLNALLEIPLVSGIELLVVVFALVTLMGDAWFMLVGLSMGYWIGPRYLEDARRVTAVCVGFATLGLATVLAIKTATAIARPEATPVDPAMLPSLVGPFVAGEIESSGFAFPSGHAVGSTVVYGGLGALLSVGRRRLRYLIAGSCILLISLSRVILQVHYPRDIVVGVGLGLGLLAVGTTVAFDDDRLRPDRVFGLAAVVSVIGFGVAIWAGHSREIIQGAIGVGTAIGGGLTWYWLGDRLVEAPPVSVPIALVGLGVAGGLWVGAYAGVVSTVGAIAASAVAVSTIVALPLAAEQRKKMGRLRS